MAVFDIGAHAGFYTLFSRLLGEEGKVFAFEPYPENLNFLVKHVQLNRIKNVKVVAAAVCKKDGFEGFMIGTSNYTGKVQTDRQTDLLVPATSMDSAVKRCKFPVPNLIKIDVEGAESLVLRGANEILKNHKPVIFIAFHGKRIKMECYQILMDHGYKVINLEQKAQTLETLDDEIIAIPAGPS